jgi:uncharacterized protein (DUF2252 family)
MTTPTLSRAERAAAGKALRDAMPRSAHASWSPPDDRADPVETLEESNQGRVAELVPLRYGRMLVSPFAFLRGSAAVMARDLAATPATGLTLQACGDCHLANFGLFATPERNVIFDINDFDETLVAPWEWDIKRLATSFVTAGRSNGFADEQCGDAAERCVSSYRTHLAEFSAMSPLEVWYFHICEDKLIEDAPDAAGRDVRAQMAAKARNRVGERLLPKIAEPVDGRYRFVENPPLVMRVTSETDLALIDAGIEQYRASLAEDRRFLFDRYHLDDFARRVVGVGSVGTRCFVGLFVCDDLTPLLLQVKEARRSVLEPFAVKSPFDNQGQRVVDGQRKMQAASDIFLGWLRTRDEHDYYVRQLRDMKYSVPIEKLDAERLARYGEICGWTLARAHAKSGDAATISGYLGSGDKFDTSVRQFALAYADQTERDHAVLAKAHKAGRIQAMDDEA